MAYEALNQQDITILTLTV